MIRLTRRHALAAGLGLTTSFVDTTARRLRAEAQEQVAPKRVVIVTHSNGFHSRDYTHEPGPWGTLNPCLSPLAPYADRLLVAAPFYNPHDRGQHGNGWATLSVRPSPAELSQNNNITIPPGGISLDRYLGKAMGRGTVQDSLVLGFYNHQHDMVLCPSSDGLEQPHPAQTNVLVAYANLFGELDEPAVMKARLARRQRILDHVVVDVGRVKQGLGADERAKLDRYLTSIDELEASLVSQTEVAASCGAYEGPALAEPTLTGHDGFRDENVRARFDLAFEALRCGMTNVAHVSLFGMGSAHAGWKMVSSSHTSEHNSHHGAGSGDLEDQALITNIYQYVFGEVAHLWSRLLDEPEGEGTMADNTLVVYVNSCGGKHHYGEESHAVVTLGNPSGTLAAGRYVELPSPEKTGGVVVPSPSHHCISDMYVTIAQALGLDHVTTFGDPDHCQGPVPAIIA